ncbi:hypothetical protein B7R22_02160 [Subtercola boreus]|uniref:HTH lacI-type domain-containing protein n=1 Tax=Subtercola boreus TaxID=120213 RepID=A0A3E0W4I1_9MICO|nr:LacI family DNA-binding transcriptional regulator [Subtercola boreus]RFA16900.1 hypothetical protein B7R22_02160 [Subtercola boreus]
MYDQFAVLMNRGRKMTVTIRDVAAHAGVSSGTVSRVLNQEPGVNERLRGSVFDAVRQLGYVQRAAKPRLEPISEVGFFLVVLEGSEGRQGVAQFWADILFAVESHARKAGIRVVFRRLLDMEVDSASAADQISDLNLSSAFLVGPAPAEAALSLRRSGLRVILIDNAFPGWEGDAVLSDNFGGSYLVTQHLISLGHQNIAFIGGPRIDVIPGTNSVYSMAWRAMGYREALVANRLPLQPQLIENCNLTVKGASEAVRRLLDTKLPFTAIVASNDSTAVGAMQALEAAGVEVPASVSVVGFDDHPPATPHLPLTTLVVDTNAMGQVAVHVLKQILAEPSFPHQTATVPVKLRIRETTAPAPRH